MEELYTASNQPSEEYDYLCVDKFMRRLFDARALATAFEIGLIDALALNGMSTAESLLEKLKTDERGLSFLLDLLLNNGVIDRFDRKFALTSKFVEALNFRDLLEMKLALSNFAAHDFVDYFTDLVTSPGKFMSKARFHRLFAYDRCFGSSKDDRRLTEQWMRITTVLTKYEAQACLRHHDFESCRRLLDVGGNSGELALRLCRHYSKMEAIVFDLPLVCDVGMDHIRKEPEANRISFVKGNALVDQFPVGFDAAIFKSMLHDWPDEIAMSLMEKAVRSLKPGGEMLIFERAPLVQGKNSPSYSLLPFLIFFHSYRSPNVYAGFMKKLGLIAVQSRMIHLETPFMLISGRV